MNLRNVAAVAGIVTVGLVAQLVSCGVVTAARFPDETSTPVAAPAPTATASAPLPRSVPSSEPSRTPLPSKGTALGAALRLKVADSPPSGRYVRSAFGDAWTDTDHNGCDQRNDVLRRDLRKRHTKPGTKGCVLAKGVLVSPYSGDELKWVKGQTSIQIDHIVSLHDAWNNGMDDATPADRRRFANDPLNLTAVDSDENREKSDKTIDGYAPVWLAPARCQFARRQVSIKAKYRLTVSAAEREKFLTILGGSNYCPGDKLHLMHSKDARVKFPAPRRIGEPKPKPSPKPQPQDTTDPRYRTCAQAKAHGYGPYTRGDTEYDWYRDQDHDGVTCE